MTKVPTSSQPFAEGKLTKYLAAQIDALKGEKTQRAIAAEVGYEKPNVLSMMKQGAVRVPLDKIPALAKALHVDPAHMFRLALEDYWPDRRSAFDGVFNTIVSKNEAELVAEYRKLTNEEDPPVTDEVKRRLSEVFGKPRRKRSPDR